MKTGEPATTAELDELFNHKRQYRKSAESIENRKWEAFEKCEKAGIVIPEDMEWYWDAAARSFTSATLWKVLG